MRKTLLAVILITAMLITPGCNQKKEKQVSIPYDKLKSEALDPIELEIYTHGTIPSDGKSSIEAMLKQIGVETAETINVHPKFNWVPYESYDIKIPSIIASGDKIDAFTCFSPKAYVDKNLVIDLSSLFKQHAPFYYNELLNNEVGKDYLKDSTFDGKLYAIPYNGVSNPRVGVVVKAELAQKYAQDGLETLEDYGVFLKRVKENESGVTPGFVDAFSFFQAYMEGNGYYENAGTLLYSRWDQNGEGIYPIEQTPEFIDAFELLLSWKNNGYVLKNNQQQRQYPISSKFLGSMLLPMEHLSFEFTYAQSSDDIQLRVIPLYIQSLHLLNTTPWGLAVTESCRNPERVMMFLEWLHSSQENYDLFMYGQDGLNYSVQNENMVISEDGANSMYMWKYFGADFFRDYRYERIITNLDPNFRQVYLDSSFTNVKTNQEIKEQNLKRKETYQEDIQKLAADYPQLTGMMDAYFNNWQRFIETIDSGVFRITVNELQEMQKETGIEDVLELYLKAMGF